MDCFDAQAAISEALDGDALDRATLDAAKQHCDTCADCAAFVRGLNLVKRTPLPEPDPGLIDRVMAAVRKEAAEKAVSEAAATPADAGPVASAEAEGVAWAGGAPAETGSTTPLPGARPRVAARPATLAAWIAAAAVLVVGAGVIGIMGIRLMSAGQTGDTTALSGGGVPQASVQGGLVPPAPQDTPAAGSAEKASQVPNYITFNGTVYRLVGSSATTGTELMRIGSTTSSLDGGEQRARDVLQKAGSSAVYVEDDKAAVLEFGVVEREFQGRTYRLHSRDLVSFGTWPSLPTEVPQPDSDDGSPGFTEAGPDSSGITVYRLTAGAPEDGIAIAPGTASTDPAGGNPGWTWWKPKPP